MNDQACTHATIRRIEDLHVDVRRVACAACGAIWLLIRDGSDMRPEIMALVAKLAMSEKVYVFENPKDEFAQRLAMTGGEP